MSKCNLSIHLDNPDASYQPGELISGRVEVEVDKECRCDGLLLELSWETHGEGDIAGGARAPELLFAGTWKEGDPHSYEFSVPAPLGPMTYHGTHLHVDWTLQARADIPWGLDPKAERTLTLKAIEPQDEYDLGPTYYEPTNEGDGIPVMVKALFLALVIGVGLALLLMKFPEADENGLMLAPILGWGFLIVGLLAAYFSIRNTIASNKLGPISVSWEPHILRPGESSRCTIAFTPRVDVSFDKITVNLSSYEQATRGVGDEREEFTYEIWSVDKVLFAGKTARAGEPQQIKTSIAIPDDAPYTFKAPSNSVIWEAHVQLHIPQWPDWSRQFTLVIRP